MFPIDYTLPPDLIAQQPCEPRDHSRLLVAERSNHSLAHHHFFELPNLLHTGDLLVLNDTRVLPARLLGKRAKTGGKWEGLFLRSNSTNPDRKRADSADQWELICQTRGTLREGEIIDVEPGPLRLELRERLPNGRWLVQPLMSGSAVDLLDRFGQIPLPPYIRKGTANEADRERYQTIYATSAGAVAAPTAGLHFTERVFAGLKERGISWTTVTLHVGLGTFQPIQGDDYAKHPMHSEWGQLSQQTVDAITGCKARGGRVIAVGTTSVRVLETPVASEPGALAKDNSQTLAYASGSGLREWSGDTNLFIHPPYQFKIVDGMITNFHLPRTTLLLLVAAFAGTDLLHQAYKTAIAERYRFYSYGDAMLILP